jgi:hypothetical protein
LRAELALSLAATLPEYLPCRRLARAARRALTAPPEQLVDLDGQFPPGGAVLLAPLAASWTRCRRLSRQVGVRWREPDERLYEAVVLGAARLLRPDGGVALGPALEQPADTRWWKEALGELRRPARRALAAALGARKRPGRFGKKRVAPAVHSQPASLATLRCSWSCDSARLTIDYSQPTLRSEFCCAAEVLWSGEWQLELRCDGRPLELAGPWTPLTWTSTDRADCFELQAAVEGGARVQRQMLLAREEGFLLMADALVDALPGRLECRSRLPLAPGVRFVPAEETSEGRLVGRRAGALVLPLGLAEWRSDVARGRLAASAGELELTQVGSGSCLLSALWFDLDPRRRDRELTWRRLSVAEDRQNVADEVAVGYRVQVGRRQWLVYRSLARPAARTVLGQNLYTDMLAARFHRSGKITRLVDLRQD